MFSSHLSEIGRGVMGVTRKYSSFSGITTAVAGDATLQHYIGEVVATEDQVCIDIFRPNIAPWIHVLTID